MSHTVKHRVMKWLWVCFGIFGLVDFFWEPGWKIANSIPILFAISVTANIIAHWAAEEASDQ